mmetsp:Transcript_17282/g.70166  ORF Transcript_17282/g.70166 Transcript_17282/m.70166 type:complete len:392 (-) Transcript_17282:704-1879(-)|eukprot:CAMPEP_0113966186 /NCGR_PEP_ID=MMETSP0011_2-20120614/8188_1 /TAXON_ID=101924 /ORGANISM="Rhodosorus marinus" /LENGTH=391 /DNA_ID=CAMNT_0000978837 /DNA_START=2746 /DNA_END=3921 /DNA_ORIENTATION=- /assembly_acc=CAM_ASM_000156
MFVTIASNTEDPRRLEVHEDMEIEILRELVSVEYSIPVDKQKLTFEGKVLSSGTLKDNNVQNDSMIFVEKEEAMRHPGGAGSAVPSADQMLQSFRTDPRLKQLARNFPELQRAVDSGNAPAVAQFLQRMNSESQSTPQFEGGEMSAEAQKYIAEQIERENIEKNLQDAIEFNPEAFAKVVMLFVKAEVNGNQAIAFIDTGAQSTIISLDCARRLGIDRLIDKRFQGMAKGVGSAKILGRIHSTVLKIEDQFLQCTFTVLENMIYDIILGLDMLRKHSVVVDVGANRLRIHNSSVSFLPEKDIPSSMRTLEAESQQAGGGSKTSVQTSSSQAAPSQRNGKNSVPTPTNFPEGIIQKLTQLGFDRKSVIEALRAANGSEEVAANILAQSRYGF